MRVLGLFTLLLSAAVAADPSPATPPFVLLTVGALDDQVITKLPDGSARTLRFCVAPGTERGVRIALYQARPPAYAQQDQLFSRLGGHEGPAASSSWVAIEQWQAAPAMIKPLIAAKEAWMAKQAGEIKGFAGGWIGIQGREQDSIMILRYFSDEASLKASSNEAFTKMDQDATSSLMAGLRQVSEMRTLGPCEMAATPKTEPAPTKSESKKKKKK